MKKSLSKLYALLCIIAIIISQSASIVSLATTTVSGSALDSSITASGSSLGNNPSSTATGPALDETTTASRTALMNIADEEHDLPKIKRVVLPTITDGTYDFTIDVDGLLSQYNSDYEKESNVYFSSIKRPARLKISSYNANTISSFVVKSKTPDIGKENFEHTLLGATEDELNTLLKQYYIWQVNPSSIIANGKWTQLTIDNYHAFFRFSTDAEGKIVEILYDETPLTDTIDNIWDGEIYTIAYTEISPEKAATQFYQLEDPLTLISETNATLYVKTIDELGNITYNEATLLPGTSGSVFYQPPTYHYANTSTPTVITNKSTFDISVTAEIHIIHGEELNFCETADFNDVSTDSPNIYMALTNGTHEVPVSNTVATASYILKGRNTDAIPYLNLTTNSEGELWGTYYSYLAPLITYDSVSFELTATIDDRQESKTAWDFYIKQLINGSYVRPLIEVVYKISEVTQDETNIENYIAECGDIYVITNATSEQEDYWVKTIVLNSQAESDILPITHYSYLIPKRKQC